MNDTIPRGSATAAALWLLLAGHLFLGACGYSQDVSALPGGAATIAIAPVRNLTGTGELDVRLAALVRNRLLGRAHVSLAAPQEAELLLTLTLTRFSIMRTLDPALDTNRSISFALNGRMSLVERKTGRPLEERSLSAAATRFHPPGVLETPAVRDEGIEDVLEAFAEKVERAIFLLF